MGDRRANRVRFLFFDGTSFLDKTQKENFLSILLNLSMVANYAKRIRSYRIFTAVVVTFAAKHYEPFNL